MPTIDAETLRRLGRGLLEATGARPEDAAFVADSLIEANLAGHDSHGVIRLLKYVEWARRGSIDPAARPVVVHVRGATGVVDGGWGWGQLAMRLAAETAIGLAREVGAGVVAVRRCNHIGRVAPYVIACAEAGMMGLAISNANPAVAPYGGRRRVFGTNPLAWAVPRGPGQPPLVHDIATAAVAEGKLRVARAKGEPLPPGLILDREGKPSVLPDDFYEGGMLLPFGGHKGAGISALIQAVGRGLAGADPETLAGHLGGNGPVIFALDVSTFGPLATFTTAADAVCAQISATPPAEGFERVLLPGEPERLACAARLAGGIPIAERTWADLVALASELGVGV